MPVQGATEPAPATASATATQRPPVVGFIGAGNVLPAYLGLVDRLVPRGVAVEGPIAVRDPARREELVRRRPHGAYVDTIDDVLGAHVDIAVVLTPPAMHVEHVAAALRAGVHVLCEKPVAVTHDEGTGLYDVAQQEGRWLVAAPFTHLAPTLRDLFARLRAGAIGRVHSARALYGNTGSTWARWFHDSGLGPLPEVGIYNLKTLTWLLGPAREVVAAEASSGLARVVAGEAIADPDPDVDHLLVRHQSGAISVVSASHAMQRYRRPAIELYGTTGTINVLGDDWDPHGLEQWTDATGAWTVHDALDRTWSWTDGLRDLALAVRDGVAPTASSDHDLHVLDVVDAARRSVAVGSFVEVASTFEPLDPGATVDARAHVVHDHTRPADEQ